MKDKIINHVDNFKEKKLGILKLEREGFAIPVRIGRRESFKEYTELTGCPSHL